MRNQRTIRGLIIALVAIVAIGGGYIFLFKTLAGKRLINSFRSNTTGIERIVKVYSYSGEQLAQYEGKILVDDGNGGTISITENGNKVVFSNVSVIIEEK